MTILGLTAKEIMAGMGIGFNIGNSFDSVFFPYREKPYNQETAWGNPPVSRELIDAICDAGFGFIRVPVTWSCFIDKDSQEIDMRFMARVREVVSYILSKKMTVIINVHHEFWVNAKDLDKSYVSIGEKLASVWEQLADYFGDLDEHLLFEGMNEPRAWGTPYEWTGNPACYKAVNYLNDIFVKTVRSSHKGCNDTRGLLIPGYAASSSTAVQESIEFPLVNGKPDENLIASVHGYVPADLCLSESKSTFDPDNIEDTRVIDVMFEDMKRLFTDKSLNVILGETGITNNDNCADRERWMYYIGAKSKQYGIPIAIWDNGVNRTHIGEAHAYINRRTGDIIYPSLLQSLFDGYRQN